MRAVNYYIKGVISVVSLVTSELLGGAAWAESQQVKLEEIRIQGSSALSEDEIRYIASSGLPTEVEIPAAKSPIGVYKQFCGGSYNDTWLKIAIEQNPNERLQETLNNPRRVNLPPCVNYKKDGIVIVREGDDFDTLVKRETGYESAHELKPCSQGEGKKIRCGTLRQMTEKLNPGVDLDALKQKQTLQLPFQTRYVTITLKPGITESTFRQELEKRKQPKLPGQINFVEKEKIIVASFPKISSIANTCSCTNEIGKANSCWTFNDARVITIIQQSLDKSKRKKPSRVSIGVIDAGFNGVKTTDFSEQLLNLKQDDNGKEISGYTVNSRTSLDDYPESPERWHGTAVAKLILGGHAFVKQYQDLDKHIALYFVQVQKADTISPSSGEAPPKYNFSIDTNKVLDAIKDRRGFEPHIINLSLGTKGEWPDIMDAIKGEPQRLIVTAAGNESQNLARNSQTWYPANYGGEQGKLSNQVITVGAYDGKLKPAGFSNFSEDYIDIWAPGCNIPVDLGIEPTRIFFTGTSFAAPQVANAVAIIDSLTNLATEDRPLRLKRRVIISADYEKGKPFTPGTGILNIERAIFVYHDVIEEHLNDDGKGNNSLLIGGLWDPDNKIDSQVCKDKDYDNNVIERIMPRRSADKNEIILDEKSGQPMLDIWFNDSQGIWKTDSCVASSKGIFFKNSEDEHSTFRPWSEIASLTPAMFAPVEK